MRCRLDFYTLESKGIHFPLISFSNNMHKHQDFTLSTRIRFLSKSILVLSKCTNPPVLNIFLDILFKKIKNSKCYFFNNFLLYLINIYIAKYHISFRLILESASGTISTLEERGKTNTIIPMKKDLRIPTFEIIPMLKK